MIPQFKVLMDPETPAKVTEVLGSGYIGQGPKVEEFETALKQRLDFDYGVTLNSGTSALWLALHLLGVGPGDYVISTPMTCSATNEVITLLGANIVWADIDKYGNISPSSAEEIRHILGLRDKPLKAIVSVDWGGMPCDYEQLRELGIPIVEDAAHAYGAEYHGESITRTGGDFITYSFQAIKHLTCGDGGLLVTPKGYYERAKLLRWYGLDRETGLDAMRCKLDIKEAGFKFHMNDINAAIGLGNLEAADYGLKVHQSNAKFYDNYFADALPGMVPERPTDRVSSDWLYTIHVPNPDNFESFMRHRGIAVSQVHNRNDKYTCFKGYQRPLPNLDKWFASMSCIPIGWWLTLSDLEYIAESVVQYVKQ